jgi:hypothetical protein
VQEAESVKDILEIRFIRLRQILAKCFCEYAPSYLCIFRKNDLRRQHFSNALRPCLLLTASLRTSHCLSVKQPNMLITFSLAQRPAIYFGLQFIKPQISCNEHTGCSKVCDECRLILQAIYSRWFRQILQTTII